MHEQVANRLRLRREALQGEPLVSFKANARWRHICQAAARLWRHGVPLDDALKTVSEAFNAGEAHNS